MAGRREKDWHCGLSVHARVCPKPLEVAREELNGMLVLATNDGRSGGGGVLACDLMDTVGPACCW